MKKPTINWAYLARRLRIAMAENDLQFRELGAMLGVGFTTLQRVSKGRPASAEVFMAVCDYLGLHPRDLFDEGGSNDAG